MSISADGGHGAGPGQFGTDTGTGGIKRHHPAIVRAAIKSANESNRSKRVRSPIRCGMHTTTAVDERESEMATAMLGNEVSSSV